MSDPDEGSSTGSIEAANALAYSLRFAAPQRALEIALDTLQLSGRLGDSRGAAYAARTAAAAHCLMSELDQADARIAFALDWFESAQDASGLASALIWRAAIESRRALYLDAGRDLHRALALCRAARDHGCEADALVLRSTVHEKLRSFGEGVLDLTRARALYDATGDRAGAARTIVNLGSIYAQMGDRESALESFKEGTALSRAAGDQNSVAVGLHNTAYLLKELRSYDEAEHYASEALALATEAGLARVEAGSLITLGLLHRGRGRLSDSLQCLARALKISRERGERASEALASVELGRTLLEAGQVKKSIAALEHGLASALGAGLRKLCQDAHEYLSEAFERDGKLRKALLHRKEYDLIRAQFAKQDDEFRQSNQLTITKLEHLKRETDRRIVEAHLQTLRAQMQPHFLLNALNSVSAMLPHSPDEADRMLVQLGDLLRMVLEQSRTEDVELGHEILFLRKYVQLEQIRYGIDLDFEVDVPPELLDRRIPHMILHPLVENAILHGIIPSGRPGRVHFQVRRSEPGKIAVCIGDDGVGYAAGAAPAGLGIGLGNTITRLERLFGANQRFRIGPGSPRGTLVEIEIPEVTSPAMGRIAKDDSSSGRVMASPDRGAGSRAAGPTI